MTRCRLPLTLALCAVMLATSGCALLSPREESPAAPQSGPQRDGSAAIVPTPPPDAASLPDAIPRVEPRSRYGNPPSYEVFGQRYVILPTAEGYAERGTASWYGPGFHGERTSSGEPYDMYAMTAAHKTLPIPAYARVTNLSNGRSVVVRINDRGPFVGDRLIDLSWSAASRLDMLRGGTAPVEVRVITPGAANPGAATAAPPAAAPLAAAPLAAAPVTMPAAVVPAPSTVAPAVAPAAAPAAAAPAAGGSFLQVASFSDASNAQRFADRLAAAGIRNSEIRSIDVAGRQLWRVRVGPIGDRVELDDYIERLALLGIPDARLAHD